RCGVARPDLLIRLPGIEPGDVDAGDPDAVRDPLGWPGRGRERDRRAEHEHEGQRRALPERHANERGGNPFHGPDVTTKSRILRETPVRLTLIRWMPGAGLEPARPRWGTPDFKSGAYDQFRHPGRRSVASPGYWPGAMSLTLAY